MKQDFRRPDSGRPLRRKHIGEQVGRFNIAVLKPQVLHTDERRTLIAWRNRNRREEYLAAAEDMFSFTDTTAAPWTVIPAEDKKYARLAVLRHILSTISDK